jgi:hypothetical protein
MNRFYRALLLLFIPVVLVSTATMSGAQDEISLAFELASAHVWRGITVTDGVVLQPSIDVGVGGLSVGTWGNIALEELDEVDEEGLFSEFDFMISYSFEAANIEWLIGYNEYLKSKVNGASREILLGASWFVTDNLTPGIECFYEMDSVRDMYIALGVDYLAELGDGFEAELGGSLGFVGGDAAIGEHGGLQDYLLSLAVSKRLESPVKIGCRLGYTGTLDEKVLPEQAADWYFGVLVAFVR